LSTRLQTELLESNRPSGLRAKYRIPDEKKIITYLSVKNSFASDTAHAADSLSAAIADGRIKDTVLLIRTSPWEDSSVILKRYETDPHIRVQVAAPDGFDAVGDEMWLEHAVTLRQSDLVIMGSVTSAVHQTAVWGIPTILNDGTSLNQDCGPFSPDNCERLDLNNFYSAGLPVAHSAAQLCELAAELLEQPERAMGPMCRIAADWDSQNPNYVDDFMTTLNDTVKSNRR
jgi:hypothetical protein